MKSAHDKLSYIIWRIQFHATLQSVSMSNVRAFLFGRNQGCTNLDLEVKGLKSSEGLKKNSIAMKRKSILQMYFTKY